MTNFSLQLAPRDRSLLQFLSGTPATTRLLLRASRAFDDGPYLDERRLRERLQVLERAGFTRHWSTATIGGGLQNYYKLTPAGFQALFGVDATPPPRSFFAEIAPSFLAHTLHLADVIVTTTVAAHARRIDIEKFFRENELSFPVGDEEVQPDCFFRFQASGKAFNLAFEIDESTETITSPRDTSLQHRLELYDAYQELLLQSWKADGRIGERPRFRVVFLTRSVARAYHLLATAASIVRHPTRRLVYAATQASYLGDTDPLGSPLFLDHRGHWQALVDLHPTSQTLLSPVRLPAATPNGKTVW